VFPEKENREQNQIEPMSKSRCSLHREFNNYANSGLSSKHNFLYSSEYSTRYIISKRSRQKEKNEIVTFLLYADLGKRR